MVFSGSLAFGLVKLGPERMPAWLPGDYVKLPAMTPEVYVGSVVPIAGLQGLSLWLSNLAYLYISVSLIQMIKASNTVWTYLWSVPLALTAYHHVKTVNLAVIGGGVALACTGAVSGSVSGSGGGSGTVGIGIAGSATRSRPSYRGSSSLARSSTTLSVAPSSVTSPAMLAIMLASGTTVVAVKRLRCW